ncbi:hypothetical protein [Streptomyces sp. NPDC050485]|uniref:hypothetical protein n=1 Tax=Streptomyces sp. NPDC050485 TaxID=3365617 RepID=UPI0037B9486E
MGERHDAELVVASLNMAAASDIQVNHSHHQHKPTNLTGHHRHHRVAAGALGVSERTGGGGLPSRFTPMVCSAPPGVRGVRTDRFVVTAEVRALVALQMGTWRLFTAIWLRALPVSHLRLLCRR